MIAILIASVSSDHRLNVGSGIAVAVISLLIAATVIADRLEAWRSHRRYRPARSKRWWWRRAA